MTWQPSPKRDLPAWAVVAIAAVSLSCVACWLVESARAPEQFAAPPVPITRTRSPTATAANDSDVARLLDSCAPSGARCFDETLRFAESTPQTIERARETCRARYAAALPLEPSSLERLSTEQLHGIRVRTLCLIRLGGDPPCTMADVDRAIAAATRRQVLPGYESGGGYSRSGRGRCRDSRGRFTRCY